MSVDKELITVWSNEKSPHCRAVRMAIELLKIEVSVTEVDKGMMPKDFYKINPEEIFPTIQHGRDFYLWQSRAIMIYLCSLSKESIAKDLYPEDPKIRAKVDQFLYFDACSLNPSWGAYAKPITNPGAAETSKALEKYESNLMILDKHLERQQYVASDNMTLADLSLGASISTHETVDLDLFGGKKFPNLHLWLERLKSQEVFQKRNNPGVQQLKEETNLKKASLPKPSGQ